MYTIVIDISGDSQPINGCIRKDAANRASAYALTYTLSSQLTDFNQYNRYNRAYKYGRNFKVQ